MKEVIGADDDDDEKVEEDFEDNKENKEEIDLATRHRLAASNERGENLGNHGNTAAAVHRV